MATINRGDGGKNQGFQNGQKNFTLHYIASTVVTKVLTIIYMQNGSVLHDLWLSQQYW